MIKYLILDTETSGINIIKDRAFLFQYGLVDEHLNLIDVQVFDATDDKAKQTFAHYLKTVPTLIGANIKFDCHMLINDGFDINIFKDKNYVDISVLARLVINHDQQTDKTFSVALKKLATKYLGIDAADEEKQLKAELSQLTQNHKAKLKQHFIDKGLWFSNLKSCDETKILNDIYNNWNKVYHKYPQLQAERKAFFTMNPAPTYADCSNIKVYGKTDIILTHGLFKLWYPLIPKLQQTETFIRINNAVYPLLLMERKGLTVDIQRVLQDRNKLIKEISKTKIIDPRTGATLNIGQHAKLKELYEYECGYSLESADKHTRKDIEDVSPAARTASYLAKMDKYLNSYITRILNKLTYVDGEYKIFTQYALGGTVTGRLASDFQQFPKESLILNDGTEINIRSWFIVPKQDKYMFYFDYASMELRLQCEWTAIINGEPDLNMARAFMPYKCIQREGKYYLEEDPNTEWTPVDLHSMTAKHAFPDVDESDPKWKDYYRQLGKRANFA